MQIIPTGGPFAAAGVKITAVMTGSGNSGRIKFDLPAGVTCEGPWNVVPGGALSNTTGVGGYTRSNVARDTGTAVGTCGGGVTFQFDFTIDPDTKRGEGMGRDSNGNFYSVSF